MQKQPLRKFTLSDALVMIAATGIGFGWARFLVESIRENHLSLNPPHGADQWGAVFSCVIIAWTIALCLLRLCRPCPPINRLGRQPGFVAGCAVFLALGIGCLFVFPTRSRGEPFPLTVMDIVDPQWIALSVAGAWLAMAMGRRWRPEPCWIDRLGRVLGICWFIETALDFWL